ncbi:MAG: hypothetical protein FJZ95_01515 [Chloroflexi bacterium]|nr:hypothetical protein [Chloroflexota bacterium]
MGGKSLWAIILLASLLASSLPVFVPAEVKASGLSDIDADGYLDIYDVYDLQSINLDLDANYELMN